MLGNLPPNSQSRLIAFRQLKQVAWVTKAEKRFYKSAFTCVRFMAGTCTAASWWSHSRVFGTVGNLLRFLNAVLG